MSHRLKRNSCTRDFERWTSVDDIPAIGVLFDSYVSQPLVARNHPFALDSLARNKLVDLWSTAEAKVRMAARSRWLRLGRALGVGPDFEV